jgi:pimeloyl-ACP methyl ester carboxylesterase
MGSFRNLAMAIAAITMAMAIGPGTSSATSIGFGNRLETGESLPTGASEYAIEVPRGTVIVNAYKPSGFTKDSPIWVVIHGARRKIAKHIGADYFDVWAPLAEQYNALLILPEFTQPMWPTSYQFQLGNVRTRGSLRAIRWRNSGFAVVQQAVDKAVALTGSHRRKFSLYGHGAGGQWVQRYILHTGGRNINRAVAANPGWYLLPDNEYRFPYGLKGAPIRQSVLHKSFGSDMVLLLGQNDVSHGAPLRSTAEARAQGRNRYERGHFYFERAKSVASRIRSRFAWRLEEVPGAGHANSEMASTAANLLGQH